MTPAQARVAIVLLERITLKPTEINEYVEVHNALKALAEPVVIEDDPE